MNYRMIFQTVGKVLRMECVLLLLPTVVSLIYGEYKGTVAFIIAAAVALVVAYTLILAFKPKRNTFYVKEGLITVSLTWVAVSLVGALPFTVGANQ